MENQYIYSIYDEKACEFSPPFFTVNDNMAKRIVMESLRGNGNMLSTYPDDFKLYKIGQFNKVAGTVVGVNTPSLIASVTELVAINKRRENNGENS